MLIDLGRNPARLVAMFIALGLLAVSPVSAQQGQGVGEPAQPHFTPGSWQSSDFGPDALPPAIADLNGDGHQDLATVDTQGVGHILLGLGDGTWRPHGKFLAVPEAADEEFLFSVVTVADLGRDDRPDLVINTGRDLYWFHGDGEGGFGQRRGPLPLELGPDSQKSYPLGVGDLNGDGFDDFVSSTQTNNRNTTELRVFVSDGIDAYRLKSRMPTHTVYVRDLAVADMDRDGTPDVVSLSTCPPADRCDTGALLVGLNDGNGTVTPAPGGVVETGSSGPEYLELADINVDGVLDAVVGGTSFPNVTSVLFGLGDGGFLIAPSSPTHAIPGWFRVSENGSLLVAMHPHRSSLTLASISLSGEISLLADHSDFETVDGREGTESHYQYDLAPLGDFDGDADHDALVWALDPGRTLPAEFLFMARSGALPDVSVSTPSSVVAPGVPTPLRIVLRGARNKDRIVVTRDGRPVRACGGASGLRVRRPVLTCSMRVQSPNRFAVRVRLIRHGRSVSVAPALGMIVDRCARSPRLHRCDLRGADLRGARFRGNMRGVDLRGANLARAVLINVRLDGARLHGANLQRSWLTRSRLDRARLKRADLRGASLEDASLTSAKLAGADVARANLTSADLRRAQVEWKAVQRSSWARTVCPDGTLSSNHKSFTCVGHLRVR